MQRVVAGALRGRRLLPLPRAVAGVRPSSSRVRGAIFDRLQGEVVEARVLDLFAGSGALAIEALSRGAAHATLVEHQRGLATFLDNQLTTLGVRARATIVCTDARRFLTPDSPPRAAAGPRSANPRSAGPRFDLVLVDPPYDALPLYAEILAGLVDGGHLAEDAAVVIEYQRHRGRHPTIARPGQLRSEAVREHGQTALEFFRYTGNTSLP